MYLIISLIVLIFSYCLFKKASFSMSLTKLNMLSYIFYIQLFVYCWVGSILVVYKLDFHYIISTITDDNIRLKGWYIVMYTMLALPIGIIFSRLLFTKNMTLNYLESFSSKKLQGNLSLKDSHIRIFLYLLSFSSILLYFYLIYYIKEIGLLKMIKGADPLLLTQFRIESSRNFQGNQYIVNIFGLTLTPILAYISYSYYKLTNSKNDFFWSLLMIFFSILFLTHNLEKGPVLNFLIGFIFLRIITTGYIPKKWLISISIIILILLVFLYFFLSGEVDLLTLFSYNRGIGGRMLLSQLSGLYECLANFPKIHSHLGISSLSKFISEILGIDYSDRAARINMIILYPDAVKNGLVGVGNTLFIGEAWANFGLLGIIISPLYVGICIGIVYNYILIKAKKTPLTLGLYTFFCLSIPVTGGFNDFIYSPVIFIIISIFILIKSISYTIRKYKNAKG